MNYRPERESDSDSDELYYYSGDVNKDVNKVRKCANLSFILL